MSLWRKLTHFIAGRSDPFDSEIEAYGPGHRVDRADFAMALIGLGAKMAKADGFVTTDEIAAFRQVFRAPKDGEEAIARLFDLAKQTTLGFEGYAEKLARRFRAHPAILEDVLDGLFHIAKADGAVTASELTFLETVAGIFGFSEREYRRIRMGHVGLPEDDPWLILGVDPDIDDAGLKRAYRRIAAQNHPDALVARGAPPEMQRLADEKMAMINAAYAQIRAIRARESRSGD